MKKDRSHDLSFSACKKVMDFFARFKKRHIFCEALLHEKSRYARQKALTGVFDGYLSNLRRDLVPLTLPQLRIGFDPLRLVFLVLFAFAFSVYYIALCVDKSDYDRKQIDGEKSPKQRIF